MVMDSSFLRSHRSEVFLLIWIIQALGWVEELRVKPVWYGGIAQVLDRILSAAVCLQVQLIQLG